MLSDRRGFVTMRKYAKLSGGGGNSRFLASLCLAAAAVGSALSAPPGGSGGGGGGVPNPPPGQPGYGIGTQSWTVTCTNPTGTWNQEGWVVKNGTDTTDSVNLAWPPPLTLPYPVLIAPLNTTPHSHTVSASATGTYHTVITWNYDATVYPPPPFIYVRQTGVAAAGGQPSGSGSASDGWGDAEVFTPNPDGSWSDVCSGSHVKKVAVPPNGVITLDDVSLSASATATGLASDAGASLTYTASIETKYVQINGSPDQSYKKDPDTGQPVAVVRDTDGSIIAHAGLQITNDPDAPGYNINMPIWVQYPATFTADCEGIWNSPTFHWSANGDTWDSYLLNLFQTISTTYAVQFFHDADSFRAWYGPAVTGVYYGPNLVTVKATDTDGSSESNDYSLILHYPKENLATKNPTRTYSAPKFCSGQLVGPGKISTDYSTTTTFSCSVGIEIPLPILDKALNLTLEGSFETAQGWAQEFEVPAGMVGQVATQLFWKRSTITYDAYGPNGFIGTLSGNLDAFWSGDAATAQICDKVVALTSWPINSPPPTAPDNPNFQPQSTSPGLVQQS